MGRRKKMQIRTITVDYARPRGYDVGYRAENNFTLLALPVPEELEGADSYRVYFESTVGEYLQTELLTPTDGYVTVKITSDIVPEPGNMAAQLVAFADGGIVGYAPTITGSAKVSIPDGTERLSHSLAAEIALNTAARHSHANKSVLDKFAESDGKPTYDGEVLGGGGGASTAEDVSYTNTALPNISTVGGALDELVPKSHTHDNKGTLDKLSASDGILTYDGKSVDGSKDFIIQMAVNDADELVSCKTTFEQVDAAYKAGKNPIVQATVSTSDGDMDYLLPLIGAAPNVIYAFGLVNYMSTVYATVTSPEVDPDSEWQYDERDFGNELADLSKNSHTHDNKAVLDLLSAADGKLKYNGSDVGLKGDKGDKGDPGSDANVTKTNVVNALGYTPQAVSTKVATGTNITLADNTEYRLTDVTTLTLNYPTGDFECWMRLKFAASGNITVTLPADTKYIGTAPDFKNGETWELSFKDKVLAAQKVGEGT